MSNIPPDDPKRTLTVAQSGNLPHIGLVGDTYTITVRGEDTNGRFCVIDMYIPPGGGPPPHRHDFEETFILPEGEIEAAFRGKKTTARAGETLNIPPALRIGFTMLRTRPYACCASAPPRGRRISSWKSERRSPRAPLRRHNWARQNRRH